MLFLSYFEGFGYPPVEAQYCNVPCIVYDLPVLREVSNDGLIYVKPGDTRQLQNEIKKVIISKKKYKLKDNIRDAASFYSFTERINNLTNELLDKRDRGIDRLGFFRSLRYQYLIEKHRLKPIIKNKKSELKKIIRNKLSKKNIKNIIENRLKKLKGFTSIIPNVNGKFLKTTIVNPGKRSLKAAKGLSIKRIKSDFSNILKSLMWLVGKKSLYFVVVNKKTITLNGNAKRAFVIISKSQIKAQENTAALIADQLRLLNDYGKGRNKIYIAVSGGRTPREIFDRLAGIHASSINWNKVHIFWTDERCVSPDDQESNYRLAKEHLLDKVGAANVYRMKGEIDPEKAARDYEKTLKDVFNLKKGEIPSFDLMLMGIGEDGHTASLFPGTDALKEKERLVVANFVPKLKSYRITLTFPVINSAKKVLFIATGRNKHDIFSLATRNDRREKKIPLDFIDPPAGEVVWIVDRECYFGKNGNDSQCN